MADFQDLNFEVNNHIARITLNRPKSYNAFNNNLSFELIDALKRCKKDNDIRVVVLTGAGEKAFSSGQDLKDRSDGIPKSLGESVEKRYNPMAKGILTMEKPVIASVNGVAAGAGAGLALAADYVISAESAYFLFAFVNIGLVPDSGTSFTLPKLVGRRKAFELLTKGEKIPAQEALNLGMINEVVPADQLAEATQRVAELYANKPPRSLALIKRMLAREADGFPLEKMLEMELYSQDTAGSTKDYVEGVMAFIEKRKPQFTGE